MRWTSSLNQEYLVPSLSQPASHHRAGATRPNDNVIVLRSIFWRRLAELGTVVLEVGGGADERRHNGSRNGETGEDQIRKQHLQVVVAVKRGMYSEAQSGLK